MRHAILGGATNPADMFGHHETEPCCKTCVPEMHDLLNAGLAVLRNELRLSGMPGPPPQAAPPELAT